MTAGPKIHHFEFTFYLIKLEKWSYNHEIWNPEVFWCEESKNNIKNYPRSSVQKLLKVLASPPLLGSGTKKGAWPKKFFSKQNGLP